MTDPARRLRKATIDTSAHYVILGTYRREESASELRPSVSTSLIYLLLLSAASHRAVLNGEVQFCIVLARADLADPGELAMISDFHPVHS